MRDTSGTLDTRLSGSPMGRWLLEFFTNSAYFPLVNILLEFLLEGFSYLVTPDPYVILLSAGIQAYALQRWQVRRTPSPLLGNLIGPTLYSLTEVALVGLAFFASPHHLAYWGFALAVGTLRQTAQGRGLKVVQVLTLLEHLVRTCIFLAMYAIFEGVTDPRYATVEGFLSDPSHVFVAIVIPALGLLIGLANVTGLRYQAVLRETAEELRRYSEWFLGQDLLRRAVADANVLTLRRETRAVLFMDIRGFTAWSEAHSPEEVVAMLNTYFETAEDVWLDAGAIKAKLTGDEVMAVFPGAAQALRGAQGLRAAIGPVLRRYGLQAGAGVHVGPLVEGLVGSRHLKGYDVLGDTVNTAKRICDMAPGGAVLISEAVLRGEPATPVGPAMTVDLKGKTEPLTVYPLSEAL